MGEVYLAEDTTLSRRVALKVLPPELADSQDRRDRFTREAKALAALNHPNIVTVYSVETENRVHFITMELVKGKTVSELLPRQGLSLERFFDVAVPLTDAVATAHEHGIIHRDLKPANVMVADDGRVKVLDFGLATPTAGFAAEGTPADLPTVAKTAEGVIVGTWNYMSPEQPRGQPVDARSDIFSLGIIYYQMLTGSRPFPGDTPTEALSSIIKDVRPSVSDIRSGLPRELSRLVRRCCQGPRRVASQNAFDIRNELAELKRELDSGELITHAGPTPKLRVGSKRSWLAAAAIVGLVVLLGLGVWFTTGSPEVRVARLQNPLQVTSAAAVEEKPTWSPEGELRMCRIKPATRISGCRS
jgi:eukaryotic-like serine/threonine-protein kinase